MATLVFINYFTAESLVALVSEVLNRVLSLNIVIVDNSDSESEKRLLERFEHQVTVISSPTNLGYFGGARLALARVPSMASGWVVLCNPDIEFASDFFSELAEEEPVGVLAPQIGDASWRGNSNPFLWKRPSRARRLWWRVLFFSPSNARLLTGVHRTVESLISRLLASWQREASTTDGSVYAPHGSCVVLSPQYFTAGGTLEHPGFLFGEELSLAEECRRIAVEVRLAPNLRTRHEAHATTGRWRSREMVRWQRESLRAVEQRWFRP